MRIPITINISYGSAALSLFVILALTVYFQLLHYSLIIPLLLLLAGVHLFFFNKANVKIFLQLGLLLALLMFVINYLKNYTVIPLWYVPMAGFAMLVMILYNDLQYAFLMALVGSVMTCLMIDGRLDTLMIFFIGSLTAVYTVRNARNRGKIIGSGFYIGIMQVATIMLMHPDSSFMLSRDFYAGFLKMLFINGFFCSFLVMATSKIFESWFGVLTNFSLLELSDFNQPLLKRMVLDAPGTYHHSLVVSNLAEAAADAIGAHSLLARVGAYYHDIGKMEKPEYFTENQLVGGNKHDHIEPSISRLVILNHVKEGMELARENKLNQKIIDFIPQHHGTSLMHFFYQKALEEAGDPSEVKEENYRYPGPKPQTREAAIVLLADSVEGATRAIDEPNPQKIEEVVRKVINNKFIDGQLDECPLTLKEIETIAATFTRILSAMYHGRVKYPEKKNASDDRHRKSTEDGHHPSSEPPPDHKKNF